jgi:hypothetical protein
MGLAELGLRRTPFICDAFSIVCVAPGASEAQVIDRANSIGKGWWAFDTLPTTSVFCHTPYTLALP